MYKRDTEIAKVAPESVQSNWGNLEGTHLTRFSPEGVISGGGLSPGRLSPYTIGSDSHPQPSTSSKRTPPICMHCDYRSLIKVSSTWSYT